MKKRSFLAIFILSLVCSLVQPFIGAGLANHFSPAIVADRQNPSHLSHLTIAKQQTPPLILSSAASDRTLEQQAQQLYESGQYRQAFDLLQQAIAEASDRGDVLDRAIALRNLALIHLKLGEIEQANAVLNQSLDLVETLDNNREKQQTLAQILEAQGQLRLAQGKPEDALDAWKNAAENYDRIEDIIGKTRNQINQAQALQAMGLYGQAIKHLTSLQKALSDRPDTLLKARALQSLGDVLRAVGQLTEAEAVLQNSLQIAQQFGERETLSSILISLGNVAQIPLDSQPDNSREQKALETYRQAAEIASSKDLKLQAQLYELNVLVNQERPSEARALLPEIQATLKQLPLSRTTIYARINLARTVMKLPAADRNATQIAQTLATAVQNAQTLGDKRAEAYALGNLGRLYEQNQRWQEAREATEKGLIAARGINAPDIAYQWQWQLGRTLCQGKPSACPSQNRDSAIAAYSQAVKTLQLVRSDLVAISSEVQFSFRESVEPVYREFASLLLQSSSPSPTAAKDRSLRHSSTATSKENRNAGEVSQDNLKQAREVIEKLQLAELDNFFRDACLNAQPVQIDQLDKNAAIFYTIILRDRLEVIAAFPGQPLRNYSTPLSQEEIETGLTELQYSLASARERAFNKKRLARSQKVYNWLIKPIESELQQQNIKTLVFVPDGLLRNIPIAALYDGQQYVVEKYSIVTAPTLNLIDPQPLAREALQVLSAGLTEARQGFSALPNVELELDRIQATVPTQILLDQSFTESNFKARVSATPVPVVHLATHGEFSSQVENTFLLAWDEKINIEELNRLLRADLKQQRPIELLVLSACQTAAGDKRAALGLAGVAVRAGARSTLASLWYVSDEATSLLMTRFYQELVKDDVTKAEALRRAQAEILLDDRFSHPYFWSAFVLVGNWL